MNIISKSIFCAVILIITLSSPPSSFGQSTEVNKAVLADQIIDQMALANQLKQPPQSFRMQFSHNPFGLPAQKNAQLLEEFKEAYVTDLLVRDFKASLQQKMANRDETQIQRWLKKQSTQSVLQAKQEYYTLQGKRKRIIALYEMEQKPASPKRSTLIATFVDTTSAVQASVESAVIVFRSLVEGLNKVSDQRNFTDTQMQMIINNYKAQMQPQASQKISNRLLVTYHNIKTNALQDYLAFFKTDAGQWLDQAINKSMQSVYEAAAERFLTAIDSDQ